MTPYFLRWERHESYGWEPVVYRGMDISDPDMIELPPECIGDDGEPKFGEIRRRFPMPEGEG